MAGTKKIRHEIELTGEQKYKSSLKSIETGLKGNKAAMTALNAEYGKNDKSVLGLTKRQEMLTQKLDQQRQKMTLIKTEYDKVVAAQGANSERAQELARDYDYARAAVTRTEKELADLATTTEKASSKWEQFKAKIKEGGGELDRVGKKIAESGAKLARYTTLPIVAGFTAAAKSAIDFETEVTKLDVITKGQVGMETLSSGLLTASNEIGDAVGNLAAAQYQAISAGIDAGASLEYTTEAAKAARAGFTDVTTAVDGSTSILNAWKMEASDATSVFDKLLTAQDLGKTTLGELSGQIGQVTGLAPQLGIALDDVLAGVVGLTKNGQATEKAMTGLKNIMNGVIKPTSEATETAKKLGLQFDAAAVRSKGLAGFLQDVMDKTNGDSEIFAKLFGSVEGLSAAMILTGNGAEDFASALDSLGQSAGTTERAFNRISNTQAQKFQNAWNKMLNAAIKFGQSLSPVIEMIGNAFAKLAETVSGMSEGQMQFAAGLLATVAAVGPALVGVGRLLQAFDRLKKLTDGLALLVGGGGTLALVVAGIAAVTAGVIVLKNHMDSMSGTNKIKAAFGKMTVDTSAIDTAIADAEGITHALEINATAKIKLSNDSEDLNNQIVAWLTDGKRETAKQKEEYKNKANEVIAPVYEAIQTAFDEKKKTLDEQLSGGIIDKATYDARLAELKATTDQTKESLDVEAQAYVAYVLTLAAQGTKPTEEQLAKLEDLKNKIIAVGDSILDAQSTALQAAKASYTLVSSGGGTQADIAKGVAYLKTDLQVKQGTLDTAHAQALADMQTQWDKANASGDTALKLKVEADMEIENQNYEASKEKLMMEYSDMISGLVDGIAKKYPEQAEKLKEIMGKQNLIQQISGALFDFDSADTSAARIEASDALTTLFNDMFPEQMTTDPDTAASGLTNYVDGLRSQIAGALESDEFGSGIFSDFSMALTSGAAEGLDLSGVGDTLKSLITAFDLAPDGKTLMEGLMTGGVEGINDGTGDLNQAIIDAALEGNEHFKSVQDMHSPSEVWRGYGANMMQGLANGVTGAQSKVVSALNLLTAKMKLAGKNSVQGMIDGADEKKQSLINKYKEIAKAALTAARQELDEHSPSRKFAQIGRYTGEGMIQGLQETQSRVQSAMTDMVSAKAARSKAAQVPEKPTSNEAAPAYGLLDGLFRGANISFTDKQSMQVFAYEVLGIWNNQIKAVGGTA